MTVKSIYTNQGELLEALVSLHCPAGFECDITYGNGSFYKHTQEPALKFDIDPQREDVTAACSTALPLAAHSVKSVVFDPPFLTYVRAGRTGNGSMIMSRRFAGYWRYDELEAHYVNTLKEVKRILSPNGILVFKCQDIVHNHRLHCTHANVIFWATNQGLRLKDLFVLAATHRMPSPNRAGKQKHARIFHSYFLVFENIITRNLTP
jgi:hypothetical protein